MLLPESCSPWIILDSVLEGWIDQTISLLLFEQGICHAQPLPDFHITNDCFYILYESYPVIVFHDFEDILTPQGGNFLHTRERMGLA